MSFEGLRSKVEKYYTAALKAHGPTPQGVDWNSAESQRTRFGRIAQVLESQRAFSVIDYGCGYGAFADYLREAGCEDFQYRGLDLSQAMLTMAAELHRGDPACTFHPEEAVLEPGDYTVASGIFNVKLDSTVQEWERYMLDTIDSLARLSRKGFSFNALTNAADPERRRPDLYYADPCQLFELCRDRYSKWVALLHDYGLYEFTIIVRAKGDPAWQSS